MKYSVYQYHMSREAVELVNSVGFDSAIALQPEIAIRREVCFFGSENFESWMLAHYTKVAEVECGDLDDVFHIGNGYGDQSKIRRVADRMHSVSVGDIIKTQDGYLWMVDPEGFECVGTTLIGEAA